MSAVTLADVVGELRAIRDALDANARGALTVAEAARWLGVSDRSVNRMVTDGELAAVSVRGLRRIPRWALEDFIGLTARRGGGGPPAAAPSSGGPVRDGTPFGLTPFAVAPNGARPANPAQHRTPGWPARRTPGAPNRTGD